MKQKQLLEGLQAGDREAYKYLYTEYYSMIKTFIIRNNGTDADAQDIFQEGLISLIQQIRKKDFHLSSKLGTYLYSIVRNKWLNKLRNTKGIDSIDDTFNEIVDEGDLVFEKQQLEVKHTLIAEIIKTIGEDCRTLLLGFYIKKQPLGQLATILNLSDNFVKIKKGRCIKELRKKILTHPDYLSLQLQ